MYLYFYNRGLNKAKLETMKSTVADAEISDVLVKIALKDYNQRKGLGFTEEEIGKLKVARGLHGKPYFTDFVKQNNQEESMVQFSVSHSRDWWACIIADEPVGFDIEDMSKSGNLKTSNQDEEEKKTTRYEAIAKRFFTEDEKDYVCINGGEGFFDIWVRKEAYIKFLGTGLSEGLSTFSVIKDGQFTNIINGSSDRKTQGQDKAYLSSTEIGSCLKAAYCTAKESKVEKNIELDV